MAEAAMRVLPMSRPTGLLGYPATDEARHLLRFPYAIERGVRFPDEPMELRGFRKPVMGTGRPRLPDQDFLGRPAECGAPVAVNRSSTR